MCALFAHTSVNAQSIHSFSKTSKTPAQNAAYLRGGNDADMNITREAFAASLAEVINIANVNEVFWKNTNGTPYVFKASEMPYVLENYATYGFIVGPVDVNGGYSGVKADRKTLAKGTESSCAQSDGLKTKRGIDLTKFCCGGQPRDKDALRQAYAGTVTPPSQPSPPAYTNIPGPQGPQGPQGLQGPQGPQGYQGNTVQADLDLRPLKIYRTATEDVLAIQKQTLDMVDTHMERELEAHAKYNHKYAQDNIDLVKAVCECCGSKSCGGCCSGGHGGGLTPAPAAPAQVVVSNKPNGLDWANFGLNLVQTGLQTWMGVNLQKLANRGHQVQRTVVNNRYVYYTQVDGRYVYDYNPPTGSIWDIGGTGTAQGGNWDIGTPGNGQNFSNDGGWQNQNQNWNFGEGQQGFQQTNQNFSNFGNYGNNQVPGYNMQEEAYMNQFLPIGARMTVGRGF